MAVPAQVPRQGNRVPAAAPYTPNPALSSEAISHCLPLRLRPDQTAGTVQYDRVWGAELGRALDANGGYAVSALGKGLDNPKGNFNCFLNVVIQGLWQLVGFREGLIHKVRVCD